MINRLIVPVAVALLLSAASGTSLPARTNANEGELPASLDSPSLAQSRIALEIRRAGGARPTIMKVLLSQALACDPDSWGLTVLDACRNGSVSCLEFREAVAKWAIDQPPDAGPWAKHVSKSVVQEARFESLSAASRRALLCEAVTGKPPVDRSLELTPADAARRLLRGGNWDLVPLVEKASISWPRSEREAVAPFVLFAKTMHQGGQTNQLVALVREAAEFEVGYIKEFHGQVPINHPLVRAAGLALDRLRVTEAVDALPQLLEVTSAYRAGRDPADVSTVMRQGSVSDSPPLGILPRLIGMLVGDLGDRSSERRIIGEATLWEEVQKAEMILLRQGRIRSTDLVADER